MSSDDKYYTAWTIVELMRQRHIKDINHRLFIEHFIYLFIFY